MDMKIMVCFGEMVMIVVNDCIQMILHLRGLSDEASNVFTVQEACRVHDICTW